MKWKIIKTAILVAGVVKLLKYKIVRKYTKRRVIHNTRRLLSI